MTASEKKQGTASPTSHFTCRPDIDGLRAVAVLRGVLAACIRRCLFHCGEAVCQDEPKYPFTALMLIRG